MTLAEVRIGNLCERHSGCWYHDHDPRHDNHGHGPVTTTCTPGSSPLFYFAPAFSGFSSPDRVFPEQFIATEDGYIETSSPTGAIATGALANGT